MVESEGPLRPTCDLSPTVGVGALRDDSISEMLFGEIELHRIPAAGFGDDAVLDSMTRHQLLRSRARELATEIFEGDDLEPYGGIASKLDAFPTLQWRADGLLVRGGRLIVIAQRKAGKTTLAANLLRACQLGEPFLGRHDCHAVARNVGYLNYEVTAAQALVWLTEIGIRKDKLYLANLRGRPNPFRDEKSRRQFASELRNNEVDLLVIDPFARAFAGVNPNDAGEVAKFTRSVDEVASEAGISEVVLIHHAGWDKERGRGSTVLEDWPDAILNLVQHDDGHRYDRVQGRDVEIPEDRLEFDPVTRILTASGLGSRKAIGKAASSATNDESVFAWIASNPLKSQQAIAIGLGIRRDEVRNSARRLTEAGRIATKRGSRGSFLHYIPTDATT